MDTTWNGKVDPNESAGSYLSIGGPGPRSGPRAAGPPVERASGRLLLLLRRQRRRLARGGSGRFPTASTAPPTCGAIAIHRRTGNGERGYARPPSGIRKLGALYNPALPWSWINLSNLFDFYAVQRLEFSAIRCQNERTAFSRRIHQISAVKLVRVTLLLLYILTCGYNTALSVVL